MNYNFGEDIQNWIKKHGPVKYSKKIIEQTGYIKNIITEEDVRILEEEHNEQKHKQGDFIKPL